MVSFSAYRIRCTVDPHTGQGSPNFPCTAMSRRKAVTFFGKPSPVSSRIRRAASARVSPTLRSSTSDWISIATDCSHPLRAEERGSSACARAMSMATAWSISTTCSTFSQPGDLARKRRRSALVIAPARGGRTNIHLPRNQGFHLIRSGKLLEEMNLCVGEIRQTQVMQYCQQHIAYAS